MLNGTAPFHVYLLWTKELSALAGRLGSLGGASLELLIAARHDPDMREYLKPLEREFGRANFELCKALLGEQRAASKGFTDFCVLVINSMLGAAASRPGERQCWRG
jgi:hypothetical protein